MNPEGESYPPEMISETDAPKPGRSGCVRVVLDILETLFISAILFLGINAISARIRVDGQSMQPTLHSGEFIIVNKLAYRLGQVQRGDVIVFHFPRNLEQEYIKRVIGLPGDEVVISNQQVRVNGDILNEPYIAEPPEYQGTWIVPEGSLFVLGDNRNNSSDSHNWGLVSLDYVVGKALVVYWPPDRWGLVGHQVASPAAP
jgi:signal peptidase I